MVDVQEARAKATAQLEYDRVYNAGQAAAGQASPQPQADNDHVLKGCEQFATTAAKEPWPPLRIQQLFNEGQSYQEQANRKMRAVELLAKHPEFEDLLELLRLVPIY